MPLTEGDHLRAAEQLIAQGHRKEAGKLLLQIHDATRNPTVKLQSIAMLVCTLNRNTHTSRLIDLCTDGIKLAEAAKHQHLLACLLASKASNLDFSASELVHRRACLKLVGPGWIWLGFALKAEETEYAALDKRIAEIREESNKFLHQSLAAAGDNALTRAYVLVMKGEILSRRHSFYQTENMKWGCLVQQLRYFGPIKRFLMFSRLDRKAMAEMARSCISCYVEAAGLYRREGEEGEEAASLLNLAIVLCTFRRFRQAASYIPQLESVAKRLNRQDLKVRVNYLRERIITQNKNIPNYAEGETVDLDG